MAARTTTETALSPEAAVKGAIAGRGNVFAVVDAAREPGGVQQAESSGLLCKSLYEGSMGERLSHVAPYLVEFRAESPFGKWWFDAWGNSAGVLMETEATFAEVRRHCRTLMVVRGQDRQKYYFRFYDPRVLRAFLPTLSEAEAKRFFGPMAAVHCEGAGGEELLTYRPGEKGVTVQRGTIVKTTQ